MSDQRGAEVPKQAARQDAEPKSGSPEPCAPPQMSGQTSRKVRRGGARGGVRALRRWAQCLHILAEMVAGMVAIGAIAAGGLAWRLSQGPLDLAWLGRRIEVAANADVHGTKLHVGAAALVWEGWQRGVDQPLDIRVLDITATAPNGAVVAAIPSARMELSPGWLLLGRVVPRSIEMDGARLRVLRGADGGVTLDLGTLVSTGGDADFASTEDAPQSPLDDLLADLARPPQTDRSRSARRLMPGLVPVSQLRRVRIHAGQMVVVDRQLGAVWSAPRAEIDLQRDEAGGVAGTAHVALALGPEHAELDLRGTLAAGGGETRLEVQVTPVSPAALARGAIGLAALANLDAPLTLAASAAFGPRFTPRQWSIQAALGAGHARIGDSTLPLKQATLTWSGNGTVTSTAAMTLVLPATGHDATVRLKANLLAAEADPARPRVVRASADLDQLPFADLATYWPTRAAIDARKWVVENITAGVAHDGHVDLTLAVPPAGGSPRITALSGHVAGDNVTATWLRQVPPIDHGQAMLTIDNPDALTIAVLAGQTGALQVRNGTVKIVGLSQKDQTLSVNGLLDGPVTEALALLRQKRLHLLDRHPVDLRDPSGTVSTQLNVSLPLENDLTIEMVTIQARTAVKNLHLTGFVGKRDVDQGQLDFAVNPDGLTVQGSALLARIPADITAGLDFRNGSPTQVVQHAEATGRATAAQLAAAGLDPLGLVTGDVDLTAQWQERRNGQADLRAHADVQAAQMAAAAVGWSKPPGAPGTLDAHVRLDHGRLVAIDALHASGPTLAIEGHGETEAGQATALVIDSATLGRSRMHGRVSFPAQPREPIRASFEGPLLDLSERLAHRAVADPAQPAKPASGGGPPWDVDARFARVLMANDAPLDTMTLHLESDGTLITRGHLQTATAGELTLDTTPGGRHLTGVSGDAGTLLRALDIANDVQGGRLSLNASYNDHLPTHPLIGNARIDDFRLRNAPALASLLQAMTLYGLVDLVKGPGLGFTRLVAPFRLEGDLLELSSARAYNPSLGLTAKGRFDLAANTLDVQGTIVPAYFFNSLLGNLPGIGELFSPEKGGGLFAATYGLHGPLADPVVRVNPLAALTPGFLRGIFD